MTDQSFSHSNNPNEDAELDAQMAHLVKVVKSNHFRYAAVAAVVGGVIAKSSDSPILRGIGVAAMLLGGFKVADAFNEEHEE